VRDFCVTVHDMPLSKGPDCLGISPIGMKTPSAGLDREGIQ
jgi:hypothetical protein